VGQGLVAGLRAGHDASYASLLRAYGAPLHDYAATLVPSWDDAAEVVQDVIVAVHRRRATLDDGVHLRSYLFRAVRNRALNHARDRRVRATALARAPAPAGHASNGGLAAVLEEELAAALRQLIGALPCRSRETFVLVRVCRLRYEDAAAILGVRRTTVATLLATATRTLRRQLAARGLLDGA
jgi:RNA polymerase sigma factor (sigma-70 family)